MTARRTARPARRPASAAQRLSGLDLGASFTNVPGGTATWTFTDATGNYNNASGTAAIVISKADATVTVNGYTGVYDGRRTARPARRRASAASALSGLDLGASFTNVPGGTATWTFTDATGNYNDASGTAAIVISKADATVTVTATPACMTRRRTARPARRPVSAARDLSGSEPRRELHQRARRHGELDLHRRDRQLQRRRAVRPPS